MNEAELKSGPTKGSQLKEDVETCLNKLIPRNPKKEMFSVAEWEDTIDIRVRSFYPSEDLCVTNLSIKKCQDKEVLTIWLKPDTKDISTAAKNMTKLVLLDGALKSMDMTEIETSNPDTFAFQCNVSRPDLISTLRRALEIIAAH